jgi:hypothetical protein
VNAGGFMNPREGDEVRELLSEDPVALLADLERYVVSALDLIESIRRP